MSCVLIERGAVYAPGPLGSRSLLLVNGCVLSLGNVEASAVRALDAQAEVIDASGCVVVPGFIDPHEHLLGGGGEDGFASRMPEVSLGEVVGAGITTVVGLLGTDTVTRTPRALLGKARELEAKGITAYMYTGGFQLPMPTITSSVTEDLVVVDTAIGVGELAIADERSIEPTLDDLAKLVSAARVGGMIGGKAGVTHFHVGPSERRLGLLRALLDSRDVPAASLYPTHITRSDSLLDEAIALARRGAYVDMDTTEPGVGRWLRYYREHGGPPDRLTLSSDAHTPGATPHQLYERVVAAVREDGLRLEEVLPHVTVNTAAALKLNTKGRLAPGLDGDVLVLDARTLALVHVFARGRHLVREGVMVAEQTG